MGIYVKDSTSLTVNEGNLNIQSEDAINVGGIYIIGQIIFNNRNFDLYFNVQMKIKNHVISLSQKVK